MALKALLCSGDDAAPKHQSVLGAIHPLNLMKKNALAQGVVLYPAETYALGARPHVGC